MKNGKKDYICAPVCLSVIFFFIVLAISIVYYSKWNNVLVISDQLELHDIQNLYF